MTKSLTLASLLALTPIIVSYAVAQPAKNATVKGASWIMVKAQTDKSQYAAGEPIKVTLSATNVQSRDAYLKFSSGQRFELKLFKENPIRSRATLAQEPAYTWSANKSFMQAVSHIKLKQGESEVYTGEIGSEMGELKPGIYRLQAQLSNSSQIAAAPIGFTVVPRAIADAIPGAAPIGTTDEAPDATLTATTAKSVYDVGEEIIVDCTLRNNANSATTFNFGSGQTYDVFVRNAAGEMVWSWAANKRFLMISRPITLKAGEKQGFSVQWNGRALPGIEIAPGTYTIEAVYASMPEVNAAPIALEIR